MGVTGTAPSWLRWRSEISVGLILIHNSIGLDQWETICPNLWGSYPEVNSGVPCGLPVGTGPLLFYIESLPLVDIVRSRGRGIEFHLYAGNRQILPAGHTRPQSALDSLEECIAKVKVKAGL